MPRPISQSHISGTQESWFFLTSSQPEATEPVHGEVAFQDGEPRYDKRPAVMQQLDGLHRPERCILVWEDHRKYFHILWQRSMYEFHCLPFGLSSASWVFTKLLRPVLAHLRRQGIRLIMYMYDMLVMAQSKVELEEQLLQITSLAAIADHLSSREVRVCIQQGEIPIIANPEDPAFGLSNRLSSNEDLADSIEDNTNCRDMQEIMPGQISHSSGASSANRKTDSNTASHIPSPAVVQGTLASEESVYTEILYPGDTTHTDQGGHAGNGVVGHQDEAREWEKHAGLRAQFSDGDGCFNAWIGSSLQQHPNWGTVVRSRAPASH